MFFKNILIEDILPSYAKLNIGLNIFDKTKNNYHIIESLIQEVDIKDSIKITIYKEIGDLKVLCKGIKINCSFKKNTCYQMANYLKTDYCIKNKIDIEINKKIPIGAGLGGGSSNAASILKYFDKQFNLHIKKEDKINICKKIGMDVPFFINGGLQYAENMGEKTTALPALFQSYFFLVIYMPFSISTKWAYSKINKDLPSKKMQYNLLALEDLLSCKSFRNDFEAIVIPRYPEIRELKEKMLKEKAIFSSLSGSGSTVFGIYEDYDQAMQSAKTIDHTKYHVTVTTPIYKL